MYKNHSIKNNLNQWFLRKTGDSSVRQVSQMPLAISSDIGNVRIENQDKVAVLRAQVTKQHSFMVAVLCDGMGGMADGAECASLSIASFMSSCIQNRSLKPKERLLEAIHDANISVYDEYHGKGGATLSAFLLDSEGGSAAINVGDSRIYSFVDNSLLQLSEDDTFAGQLNKSEKPNRLSNELLQYIGIGEGLEPHNINLPNLDSVSTLMISSDGVHFLNSSEMEAIIRHQKESITVAKRLVELSKWSGGKDNSSVIVLKDPSLVFLPDENELASGVVEIWDAFGEVRLIGVEDTKALKFQQMIQSLEDKIKKDELTIKAQETQLNELTKLVNKKKKAPLRKTTVKKASTSKKPQIKIDFHGHD